MEHRLHLRTAMTAPNVTKAKARGFTLVELLVVVGIISIMAAVSLPSIAAFVRNSRVRSAQDQVASAIQRARSRAIALNTQFGVSFVIESANPSVFWVHIEDPLPTVDAAGAPVVGTSGRQPLINALPTGLSTRYPLDDNVQFAVAAGQCPAGPAAGNQTSMRFDRYGVRTLPAAFTFVPSAPGIFVPAAGAEATICLVVIRNGVSRLVTIAPGGRVKKG